MDNKRPNFLTYCSGKYGDITDLSLSTPAQASRLLSMNLLFIASTFTWTTLVDWQDWQNQLGVFGYLYRAGDRYLRGGPKTLTGVTRHLQDSADIYKTDQSFTRMARHLKGWPEIYKAGQRHLQGWPKTFIRLAKDIYKGGQRHL